MATNLVLTNPVMSAVTGNQLTLNGATWGSTGTGTITTAACSAVPTDMSVQGDIQGMLYLEFADPDTLDGVLTPAELATAQIGLTQAHAGGAIALLAEEIYLN